MDEYSAYTIMLLKADFRTGFWSGSGKALAATTGWCVRKAQIVLEALSKKGYLELQYVRGKYGNYPIRILRYFKVAHRNASVDTKVAHGDAPEVTHRDAPVGQSDAPGCAALPKVAHGDATSQEVVQEEIQRKKETAQKTRDSPTPSKQEQTQLPDPWTVAQRVNGRGGMGSIRAGDLGLKPKKHILEKEKARREQAGISTEIIGEDD